MILLFVLLRIALSAVFGIAGVTKLLDLRGTREAVKNFGAPEWLVPALAIVLPIVELTIAVGLLFVATAQASALAAVLILVLFILAISVNLAQGRTPDCHCFGQIYSRPLGWPTLVRNLIFALAALAIFWQAKIGASLEAPPSIVSTLAKLSSLEWLLLIAAVAVAALVLFYFSRRQTKAPVVASEPPKGLPLDAEAPPFEAAAYTGGTTSLADLLAPGKPLLLIFTNPKCGPCVVLFEEIKDWQQSHSERLTIALLSMGTIKENFVNVARNGLGQVLLQKEREIAVQYGASVTPTAVVVNPAGRIASPIAAGADEIRHLLTTVVGNSHGTANHKH